MAHNYRLLKEEANKPVRDISRLITLVLHVAFYWYNFMPLSRGTAAVGLATIHAMFLALGYEVPMLLVPFIALHGLILFAMAASGLTGWWSGRTSRGSAARLGGHPDSAAQ